MRLLPRARRRLTLIVRPPRRKAIIVLGAGALGSIIGAHLVRAGEEVVFIARGHRAAFLQQHGIVITGLVDFTVPVTVTTHPNEVQAADALFVTVKTYDTKPALASLRQLQQLAPAEA